MAKAGRQHTIKEAAEDMGLPVTTLHKWAAMEGAPFDKNGNGKASKCDPAELRAWADDRGLTGKVGRPKNGDGDEGDSDYWLGRWRKAKALREERSVIPRAEHERIISQLAIAAATKLRELPAAVAPALVGLTAIEIETEIGRKVGEMCDYLSDSNNYRLPDSGD